MPRGRRVLLTAALLFAAWAAPAPSRAEDPGTASTAPVEKVLRVATSGDYAPFSMASASDGDAAATFTGFDIEVATAFARERGYRLEFHRFRWPDLGKELAAASFDVAMSGVTLRPERSLAGRYSVPVAASHAMAIAWKGSGVSTMQELDRPGRRVAVNAGGHLEAVAHRVFHRAEVFPLADNEAVRMALLDRTFDAVVTDSYEEKVWTANARGVIRIGPLSDDRKAYLMPADRDVLAAELDRWLLAREKDGTLAALRVRYLAGDATPGSPPADTSATAEPVAALATAISERLALMPMVYEAKRAAGKPIEDKVQEAAVVDSAMRAVAAASAPEPGCEAAKTCSAPVDDAAARFLFETLIEMGKDVQQQLADAAARRRPGVVHHRMDNAATTAATAKANAEAARVDGSGAAAPETGETGKAPPTPQAVEAAPAGDGVKAAPAEETARASAEDSAARAAANADHVDAQAPGGAGKPEAAADGTATIEATGAARAPAPADPAAPRVRLHDLATDLRPAIGRITDRIARIVVAMDKPVTAATARARLAVVLGPQGVRSDRLDALASAVERLSTR